MVVRFRWARNGSACRTRRRSPTLSLPRSTRKSTNRFAPFGEVTYINGNVQALQEHPELQYAPSKKKGPKKEGKGGQQQSVADSSSVKSCTATPEASRATTPRGPAHLIAPQRKPNWRIAFVNKFIQQFRKISRCSRHSNVNIVDGFHQCSPNHCSSSCLEHRPIGPSAAGRSFRWGWPVCAGRHECERHGSARLDLGANAHLSAVLPPAPGLPPAGCQFLFTAQWHLASRHKCIVQHGHANARPNAGPLLHFPLSARIPKHHGKSGNFQTQL